MRQCELDFIRHGNSVYFADVENDFASAGLGSGLTLSDIPASKMEMSMHVTHAADEPAAPTIALDAFLAVDIRVGTIVAAEPFPEARKPALKLTIDFGPVVGRKRSSAQIVKHYGADTLVGRQVAAVVNFPPRQIGKFMSEVLTLGFPDADGEVVLFAPDQRVPDGGRLF
jgi:tRNA-binding protein